MQSEDQWSCERSPDCWSGIRTISNFDQNLPSGFEEEDCEGYDHILGMMAYLVMRPRPLVINSCSSFQRRLHINLTLIC